MSLVLIASERFADHLTPPGHPDSPDRAETMHVIAREWREQGGDVVAPRAATEDQLARVHERAYLRAIAETAGVSSALDHDTYTSPDTHAVALLAAGAVVDGVERVLEGRQPRAFALVRPPGHHAERARAMGFCIYNNIAVGAAHARALGAARVAIVDFDVHHGNGTQHMFDGDPSILYVSLHQAPFYPGTGDADEVGTGAGAGHAVNVPIEGGAGDDDYRLVFSDVVIPVLTQFRPDLLLVSAGFDAHERDPLAGMRLTTPAFAAMTLELRRVADAACQGRMVLATEGGYDIRALAASLRSVVEALATERTPNPVWPASGTDAARGRRATSTTQRALGRYWSFP